MLTIITPSFNRAHTLRNVYNSLINQSDSRFIWMIVDDGSTDNTEAIVDGWKKENKIRIEYYKKDNGGKASALNLALKKINTPYAVCLDSDDIFFPNAVADALSELEMIQDPLSCGILALRNNSDGSIMGGVEIPKSMNSVTASDIFLKLNLCTELICFYKTDILTQYTFPEFANEKFVSPAWMQYEITQKYHYIPSWKKYCECEYISDGLTKNKRKVIAKNPRGYSCVKKFSFNLAPTLRLQVKHGIMYDCGCLIARDRDWLKGVKHKFLAVVLMPVAFAVKKIRFGKWLKV